MGDFIGVDSEAYLNDYFKSLALPTVGGFKITHEQEKITLPIGKNAKLAENILKISD